MRMMKYKTGEILMKNRNNQLGTSKIGLLIITIVIIVVAYAALKYIPVKLNAYEFQDFMERIARDPAYHDKESITNTLMNKARELDLPIKESQIKVSIGRGSVDIDVNYQVVIQTPFMEKTLIFNPKASEKRIY
jgi:hypothetical protein